MTITFDVPEENMGYTAGKKSCSYNLGDDERPREIDENNILDFFLDIHGVAQESLNTLDFRKPVKTKYYVFRCDEFQNGDQVTVMAQVIPTEKVSLLFYR